MTTTHYSSGEEDALLHLGLEKTAFVAAALRGLGGMLMRGGLGAARGLGSGFSSLVRGGTAMAYPLVNAGESAIASGIGRVFGAPAAATARSVLRNVGTGAVSSAIGQGLIGGALQGGLGAMSADRDRGRAFLSGFGRGFLENAAIGGITGGLARAGSNVARMGLRSAGAGMGLNSAETALQARRAMDRGFFGNIRDLASSAGPTAHRLGRRGSAMALAGSTAEHAANIGLPMLMMMGGRSEPPPPPPNPYGSEFARQRDTFLTRTGAAASDDPEEIPSQPAPPKKENKSLYIGTYPLTMMGSTAVGKAGTEVLVELLERQGYLPPGSLKQLMVSKFAPIAGTLSGALAGHYIGTKLTEDNA